MLAIVLCKIWNRVEIRIVLRDSGRFRMNYDCFLGIGSVNSMSHQASLFRQRKSRHDIYCKYDIASWKASCKNCFFFTFEFKLLCCEVNGDRKKGKSFFLLQNADIRVEIEMNWKFSTCLLVDVPCPFLELFSMLYVNFSVLFFF